MTRPRGLTLLEVLLSVVLMTMLAVVCMPLMRTAMAALDRRDPGFEPRELAALADAFVAAGAAPVEDAAEAVADETIAWPEHPDRPPVTITRFERTRPLPEGGDGPGDGRDDSPNEGPDEGDSPDDPTDIGGAWLVFECAPFTVCRWQPQPGDTDASDEPEEPGDSGDTDQEVQP